MLAAASSAGRKCREGRTNANEAGMLLRVLKPLVTQSWRPGKLDAALYFISMWDGPTCGVVESGAPTTVRLVDEGVTHLVITGTDDHADEVDGLREDRPFCRNDPLEPRCQACSRRRADRSCNYCGMIFCQRCIIMGRTCRCRPTRAVVAPCFHDPVKGWRRERH